MVSPQLPRPIPQFQAGGRMSGAFTMDGPWIQVLPQPLNSCVILSK